jgi:transposase-like protein
MGQAHPSTAAERAQWAAIMLAHQGIYGMVTHLSRETGVSRPTLYAWREQALQLLLAAWTPPVAPVPVPPDLTRQVLTLWAEAHASDRGIQTCLRTLTARGVSLATIIQILHDAQQRAIKWCGLGERGPVGGGCRELDVGALEPPGSGAALGAGSHGWGSGDACRLFDRHAQPGPPARCLACVGALCADRRPASPPRR